VNIAAQEQELLKDFISYNSFVVDIKNDEQPSDISPSNPSDLNPSGSHTLIVIVIVTIVILALILGVVVYFYVKRRNRVASPETYESMP
jgi:hypothetical protein